MNLLRITLLLIGVFTTSLTLYSQEYRTYDGSNNHAGAPNLGKAHTPLRIATFLDYEDEISAPSGADRPIARTISNQVFAQKESVPSTFNHSDLIWAFGQFLDHDITFVEEEASQFHYLPVPICDSIMDPYCTGAVVLPQKKSKYTHGTGTSVDNPRTYDNSLSTWIDGSTIYGSSEERANWLRSFTDGKLKVSEHDYLPFNTVDGDINSPKDPTAPSMDDPNNTGIKLYVAGDVRANENPFLISLHTLFVREHNRICDEIIARDPLLSDEVIFQTAREQVIATLQSIVYNEYLPALGLDLETYTGYDDSVDPRISNLFSAAAFRMGHTQINGQIRRLEDNCQSIRQGSADIRDGYFDPVTVFSTGISPMLKGMISQTAQNVDCKVVDDVRNFLFVPDPNFSFGLDLVAFNIERGRERGIPSFIDVRASFGLSIPTSFKEITSDTLLAASLEETYGSLDKIDAWVGLLAEDHVPGTTFGETLGFILRDQFRRLRDGDRFFYLNSPNLSEYEKQEISETTIADVIKRNTELKNVQNEAFFNTPVCVDETANELASIDIMIHPNPTTSLMHLTVFMKNSCDAHFVITDVLGKQIHTESHFMDAGYNVMDMNITEDMKDGIYFVRIGLPDGTTCTKKFAKLD